MGLFSTFFRQEINKRAQSLVGPVIGAAITDLYNKNIFRWLNEGQVVMNAEDFDYGESAYNAVGAVYECVDIISKKIISCPRILYRVKDERAYKEYLNYRQSPDTMAKMLIAKAEALEEVSNIPQIKKLLNKPNKKENGDHVFRQIAAFYLLRGNSYLYGNGSTPANRKWSELFALPPDMQIVSGGMFDPVKEYVLQNYVADPFPAAQVKHFKTFNPVYSTVGTQLYGVSPLRAYLYSMNILKDADKQANKQLKNGGKMGFVSPKNKEDQFGQQQKEDLSMRLSSAHRSDGDSLERIIPASVPLEWTEIGLSAADMDLLNISGAKADDIYRAYHIPLQFRNQDSSTYNNLPVANRQFIYNAVAPITREIELGLTEFLCEPYNTASETYVIHLDYTSLPELSEDMKSTLEWLDKAWFLTPNEKREVIGWGRSMQVGMDEIMINRNLVRLQDIIDGKITYGSNNSDGPSQSEQAAQNPGDVVAGA